MSVWGRFFSSTSAAEIRVFDSLNRIQEYSSKVTMTWMWADMSLLLQFLLCYFVLDELHLPILIHLLQWESIRSSEYDDSTLPFGPFCVWQCDAVDNPMYVWQKKTLIRFTFEWNSASPLFKVFLTIIKTQPQKRRAKRAVAADFSG
jgi:hypothetical protein